jgi:Zn finger protein HypA/HybF involved in hydrogenase expression
VAQGKKSVKAKAEHPGIVPCQWCEHPTPNWSSITCDDCRSLYLHIGRKYKAAVKMISVQKDKTGL